MSPRLGYAWRFAALAGLATGLALSPAVGAGAVPLPVLAATAFITAIARPRRGVGALPWLVVVTAVALAAGVTAGSARLAAIDAGALDLPPGERVSLSGLVASTPKVVAGATRFILETEDGRVGVSIPGPADVDEGRVAVVRGVPRPPGPWERSELARHGALRIVAADSVRATPATRGGLRGALDGVRRRAEAALEQGTSPAGSALLRGFVLGQDDRIPEPVRDDFRRSGLAHVLAVSGQNVMLLALLATPILALAGVPLRLRLVALVALIAVYVPVAGGGASIQRAGVMGAAGLVAALAGRPRARWYALLLAAAVTLALNPRATGDIGWQLSFAAVAGLLVLAAPLARSLGARAEAGPGRRLVAEGAALTVAATLATAPLAAHHFGTVSVTAIPANLLALPAVAPAMWLGMLAGGLGQIPAAPVEPLTALGGLCAGFIAWVAHSLGGTGAQLDVAEPGLVPALALSAVLLAGARLACGQLARRESLRPGRLPARAAAATVAACLAALAWLAAGSGGPETDERPPALRIRVLDVGQGDAVLLEPRGAPAILIDTGPPGAGAADRLAELGVDALGAIAITHDQLDHSGALAEILARTEVGRLVVAAGGVPEYCRHAACPEVHTVSAGDLVRSGRLRLSVLWPRPGAAAPGDDPNARSLVLLARLGPFQALLTGDAEAEAAAVQPGPVDLLKVAHHGSADAGLPALLARTGPELAVISVGEANPYGHPAAATIADLGAADVPVLRTDEAGEVVLEVRGDGWAVE